MNRKLDLQTPPKPFVSFDGFSDLLTMKDGSVILQQSEATVRRLCREGELPSIRIGRRLYIPKSQLVDFIEAHVSKGVA